MTAPTTGERAHYARFECPTCFRLDTKIRDRDIREEGYSVIRRVCRSGECPSFTTVETVVYDNEGELANFNQLAPNKRLADRERQQQRKGYGGRRAIKTTDSLDIRIRYLRGTDVEYVPKSCYQGHEYTDESSYINKHGKRICRECRKIAQRTYMENHAERLRDRQIKYQRARRARLREEREGKAA